MKPRNVALALVAGALLARAARGGGGTLGERALAWCREQLLAAPVPSAERIAAWFAPAERGGRRLGVSSGNHCAVAQSAAVAAVLRPGETAPHGYRAGSREFQADAQAAGRWLDVAQVRAGARPRVGDLAIYDRSDPARPETAWQGHVDRVAVVEGDRYQAVGANGPGRAWYARWARFDAPRLLGFVRYP